MSDKKTITIITSFHKRQFQILKLSSIQYLLHISELLFHSSSRGGLVLGSCDVFSGGWDDMGAAA